MWIRQTYHQCATELDAICADFRAAYLDTGRLDSVKRDSVMHDRSRRGIELLRILALSIRSEQDYGLLERGFRSVGAVRWNAIPQEFDDIVADYCPPIIHTVGFRPLSLRQALNSIAHANPERSRVSVGDRHHDLLLSGVDQRGRTWIAVIQLLELIDVVKSMPDVKIEPKPSGWGRQGRT